MTRVLVVGNPVVTLGHAGIVDDGALVVEDRAVVEAGPRAVLEQHGPFDRVVGSTGHLVLPGFVNGHFHTGGVTAPGLFQYVFERANIHANRRVIAEEDLYDAVLYSLLQCIRGGQTGVVDFSYGRPDMDGYGHEPILRAYADAGIRGAVGIVTRDQNIYVHGDDEAFIGMLPPHLAEQVRGSTVGYAWPVADCVDVYRRLVDRWDRSDGRIRLILAPDWTPSCSDGLYRLNRRLADEYGTGITSHVLETRSEMLFNLRAHGVTGMRRLAGLGVLGPDVSLAHFVWATDEDIAIVADTGAIPVNNAGSNLRLSTGIARTRDMLEAGVEVAFGTDSISFSEHEDFFQELRLALYLQRTPGDLDVGRLDSLAVLRSAARAGARAIRMERELGSLEVGKEADLLVVDRSRIFWPPGKFDSIGVLDTVLDRAEARDIDSVMIAGRLVVDGGRVTTVDEEALRERITEGARERYFRMTEEGLRRRRLGMDLEPYVFAFYDGWSKVPVEPAYAYNAKTPPPPDWSTG